MAQAKRQKRACAELSGVEDLTEIELVCEELRELQWKTNCSTLILQLFLQSLRGNLGNLVRNNDKLPRHVNQADKKMQRMVRCNLFFSYNVKKLNIHTCNRRLANKLFIYMAASAVQKSGDRETRKMYARRAGITDSMIRASRVNMLYTFHCTSASKVYSSVHNTVKLCDGKTVVRKAMTITSQVNIIILYFIFVH